MEILQAICGFAHGIISWLFDDDGIKIVEWYLVCLTFDCFIGTYRSMVKSRFKSRSYLQGIFLKIISMTAIPATNALDSIYTMQFGQLMIGKLPIDISDIVATMILIYEVFSILENLYAIGALPKSIKRVLSKILDQTNFKDMYPKD